MEKVIYIQEPIELSRDAIRPTKTGSGFYTSIRVEAIALVKHKDGSTTRVKLTGWWNPTIRAILDVE